MRGLVLAAGRGSRLGEVTRDRPKAFVEVAGATLFSRQSAALRLAGVSEVGIATGWAPEHAQATGCETFHNPEWARTTMVGSLRAADPWLTSAPTLVAYGDILFSTSAARLLAADEGPLAVGYDADWFRLWSRRMADPMSDAESFRVDATGAVFDIGRQDVTREEAEGQYVGLVLVRPPAWRRLTALIDEFDPECTQLDMTALLRVAIEAGVRVSGVSIPGPWCEIDSAADLLVADQIARELDEQAAKHQ